jgi:TM2 domain-containing membrane protein YozV
VTSRVSDRAILPAFLLCLFFGIFGAHRFYAGRIGSAVAMLVLFFVTLGVVPAFWMLVDLIILATSSFRDGQGNIMRRWI